MCMLSEREVVVLTDTRITLASDSALCDTARLNGGLTTSLCHFRHSVIARAAVATLADACEVATWSLLVHTACRSPD